MGARSGETRIADRFFFAHTFSLHRLFFFFFFFKITWGYRCLSLTSLQVQIRGTWDEYPSSIPVFSFKGIWNARCDALHRLMVSFFPLFIFCLSLFLFPRLLSYFLPYSFIVKIYLSSLFLQSLCLPSFSSLPYFPPLPFSLFSSPFRMFNCPLTVSLPPLLYSSFCLPPHFPSFCLSFPSCFASLFSLLFLLLSSSLVFTAQLWVLR